jgi:MFS family permease
VIVAGIVVLASPAAAVLTGAAVACGAAIGFSLTGASRSWRGERHEIGWLGPLESPGMRVVTLAMGTFGAAIGVLQVAVPAFMAERGAAETGGLLLACLSAGSLVGGLVYGGRTWPGTPRSRLVGLLAGLAAAWSALALAGSPVALGIGLVIGGVLLAPATVVASHLLDDVAPRGTVTEAFGVMVMGLVTGTAGGAALGGQLVDGPGFPAAMLAAGGVCLLGALVALRIR